MRHVMDQLGAHIVICTKQLGRISTGHHIFIAKVANVSRFSVIQPPRARASGKRYPGAVAYKDLCAVFRLPASKFQAKLL